MRELNKIIVHCSDSDLEAHDNLETIRKWHVDENGWKDVGYHFVITKDGNVHKARDIKEVGAHTKGENLDSIGICLTGRETFSPDQYFSLAWLLNHLLESNPSINQVRPHRYYSKEKTCPNFDLRIFETNTAFDR